MQTNSAINYFQSSSTKNMHWYILQLVYFNKITPCVREFDVIDLKTHPKVQKHFQRTCCTGTFCSQDFNSLSTCNFLCKLYISFLFLILQILMSISPGQSILSEVPPLGAGFRWWLRVMSSIQHHLKSVFFGWEVFQSTGRSSTGRQFRSPKVRSNKK